MDRSTPVPVCAPGQASPCDSFLRGVHGIAAGTTHSLAFDKDGTVLAWGDNRFGELGNGTTSVTPQTTPVPVCAPGQTAPCSRFLTDVRAVAGGSDFSLALRNDGTVLAWGFNGDGELGDGTTTTPRTTPVQVCAPGQTAPCTRFLTDVVAIAAGFDFSVALRKDGTVFAWGDNFVGELGNGTTSVTPQTTPVQVCAPGQTAPCTRFLTDVRAIATGDQASHSLALRKDGTVLAWGANGSGQLGDGTTATPRTAPVRVCAPGQTAPCTRFLHGVRDIAANGLSGAHSLALHEDGTVLAWGANGQGEVGDGTTTTPRTTPVRVCAPGQTAPCTRFLHDVRAITAGAFHSLALHEDGTVLAWGANGQGEVGDGTTTTPRT
ncbi:RCC1 domain-containing protein, partial [Kitasatospora sp. NPDC058190]|uniref:RCC1 domain-containing protein n=1 Tax=Kitasatospora sp. NPDC058190 TaxID=3346371 RepID=UPI0036DEAA50